MKSITINLSLVAFVVFAVMKAMNMNASKIFASSTSELHKYCSALEDMKNSNTELVVPMAMAKNASPSIFEIIVKATEDIQELTRQDIMDVARACDNGDQTACEFLDFLLESVHKSQSGEGTDISTRKKYISEVEAIDAPEYWSPYRHLSDENLIYVTRSEVGAVIVSVDKDYLVKKTVWTDKPDQLISILRAFCIEVNDSTIINPYFVRKHTGEMQNVILHIPGYKRETIKVKKEDQRRVYLKISSYIEKNEDKLYVCKRGYTKYVIRLVDIMSIRIAENGLFLLCRDGQSHKTQPIPWEDPNNKRLVVPSIFSKVNENTVINNQYIRSFITGDKLHITLESPFRKLLKFAADDDVFHELKEECTSLDDVIAITTVGRSTYIVHHSEFTHCDIKDSHIRIHYTNRVGESKKLPLLVAEIDEVLPLLPEQSMKISAKIIINKDYIDKNTDLGTGKVTLRLTREEKKEFKFEPEYRQPIWDAIIESK